MRFQRFLREDVISKALGIQEPMVKKQYDPDVAERYLETIRIAIEKVREKGEKKGFDPEKEDPALDANDAILNDLQDKYDKWEEVASADDEAEGEEPADEDPTSEPGEDPNDMPPEEGEEEPPDEEEPDEEEPKKKKKPPVEEKTNKLRAIFDVPGKDDPTSQDDPKPGVDPDEKYPLTPVMKRKKNSVRPQAGQSRLRIS